MLEQLQLFAEVVLPFHQALQVVEAGALLGGLPTDTPQLVFKLAKARDHSQLVLLDFAGDELSLF